MTTQKITPAMQQWHDMKSQHPDKLLFFRMGDFYELFHNDAVKASKILGLTLTKRGREQDAPPLAGIPHHQIDKYVKELIDKGISVAICDQLEDPAQAKGVVKRGITRVITPGTVVDDNVLPPVGNNYLAAACCVEDNAAVALADISTGEFIVCLPQPDKLADAFERYAPAETLVPANLNATPDAPLAKLVAQDFIPGITKRDDYAFNPHEGETILKSHYGVATLKAFGIDENPAAISAAGAVLAYLMENQPNGLGHLKAPRIVDENGILKIDRNTIRNLELAAPPRSPDRHRTLLGILDHTMTGPGARLLRTWLLAPPSRLAEVKRRQEAVGELLGNNMQRETFRKLLDRMADFERIMARVAAERANPRDLNALAAGCRKIPDIKAHADECAAKLLNDCGGMDPLEDLADIIEANLDPDPPVQIKDGGIIRSGANALVDEYRDILGGGKDWIQTFQESEQQRTGIPSLKVGFNKVFGFFIEITNAHKDKAPPEYIRKQTLVNAERYITPELKKQEEKVLGAEEKLHALEYDLFCRLRQAVGQEIQRVQNAARQLAELDVVQSLAQAGAIGRYVMPEVHDGLDSFIEHGRHPVVEQLIPQGSFVDNDTRFDEKSQRVLIITGPNMAGKSTYIRQTALLFIMAHMGAPVPAKAARIGLADRVFSRVGASDDLARGQSTFMVEMVETAEILRNATPRSLVILDEVGRGTSTFDGVSLAWAITEFLHQKIRARVLFATHYHELAELGFILDAAKNFNVAVKDWEGEVVFLRRIQPGACDRSYGIHVAKLAGVPPEVLKRSSEILAGLEEQAAARDSMIIEDERNLLRAAAREVQLELFPSPKRVDEIANGIMKELSNVDSDLLSPMDAHRLLAQLAERARGR